MAWDPDQYLRFRRERRQPFFDLIDLVEPAGVDRIVDLGCGTGEMTRLVHERLGARDTLGVDSSVEMLAGAAQYAVDGVRFERRDIADIDGAYDLVLSNAALHWLPDHPALFAHLTDRLGPGGQLAVQVPANHDHPAHFVADEVAGESPFAEALGGYRFGVRVLDPREYAELLHRLGYARMHVRLQIYGHELPSRDDVVEWLKGSMLTEFERRLPADVFAAFLGRYRERLHERLSDERPYYYTYKRILMWAAKSL